MPVLQSKLMLAESELTARREHMQGLLRTVRDLEERVRAASAAQRARFEQRGQLLPRERVAELVDRSAPFLELSTLAGLDMHDDSAKRAPMGGGSILGIGQVSGKRCLVLANDSAIKGGTISPMGLKKNLRAQEIAQENKLPLIYLVESGGANLLYQSELFVEGGRAFANQARLSAAGIPQIAVVHGSSTAGGAYLPGLSDYVVLVRGRSKIFLAGPPLVRAAIGEETSDEALGGAALHAEHTGLGEYLAEDDAHAMAITRELLRKLRWDAAGPQSAVEPPRYPAEELLSIVPPQAEEPYDVREVIARIVDGSDFLELKSRYGPDTVCGHAHIEGHAVGLIGNAGPIQPSGASKVAHFIQACEQTGTPLVFLQNTTGFMVGSEAERQGAVKHGSQMIAAVANAQVPKLTIVLGGSYGAGNYGMCGRGFSPRFIFSWPSAKVAVMGGAQAAMVMDIVAREKAERSGQPVDEAALSATGAGLRGRLEAESSALFATARLWDDGIIDPRDTRRVLGLCLSLCAEAQQRTLRPSRFGVTRM